MSACSRKPFQSQLSSKRYKEVLVLFFVFSEAMLSLEVFIFSSVYVTINPGTSPVVTSPSCLVELLLYHFLGSVDRILLLSHCHE